MGLIGLLTISHKGLDILTSYLLILPSVASSYAKVGPICARGNLHKVAFYGRDLARLHAVDPEAGFQHGNCDVQFT